MGKGKDEDCSHCKGRGTEWDKCNNCGGTGFNDYPDDCTRCKKCSGFKEIEYRCVWCRGTGKAR